MSSLTDVSKVLRDEIDMSDICLANILTRLDEDIARINERKQQITDEFAARRRSLEGLLGPQPSVVEKINGGTTEAHYADQ
jgi:hypothetical protein